MRQPINRPFWNQRRGFLEVFKNLPLEQGISKEGQVSLSHAKVGVAADKRSAVGVVEAEKALSSSLAAFGPNVYPFYLIIHMYTKMKMPEEVLACYFNFYRIILITISFDQG